MKALASRRFTSICCGSAARSAVSLVSMMMVVVGSLPRSAMGATPDSASTEEAAPANKPFGDLEEITVSASRIARTGFSAPTPTTILGADQLPLISYVNVGDLAHQIPQLAQSQSSSSVATSAPTAGANYFDLRGLGAIRTLTLVDGRRHVPNYFDGSFDTNVIPSGIIDSVEVVTGGASAAYGADAVAGVVNIRLRKDIEGLEATVQGGQSAYGDDRQFKGTLNFGTKFAAGRGSLMFASEFSQNNGVLSQGSRDWAQGGYGIVSNPAYAPGNGQYQNLLTPNARIGNATFGGLITSGVLKGTEFGPGGVPMAFNPGQFPFGSSQTIGGDGPLASNFRMLDTPVRRDTLYMRSTFDVSDKLTAWVEGNYSKSVGDTSHLVYTFNSGGGAFNISTDNAYLPSNLKALMLAAGQTSFTMNRINSDFGFFGGAATNETREFVVGLDGKFGEGWTWHAYYQVGDNGTNIHRDNDIIVGNLKNAADAVVNPATGSVVCRSTLTNPGNGCVPIDLFGSGSPSPQALNYVTDSYSNWVLFRQDYVEVNAQGEPFQIWAGPISVAGGLDYRKESISIDVDPLSAASGHLFGNQPPNHGSYDIKEAFAETVIPLLKDLPFAKELDFNGAVRETDHSTAGAITTWKGGVTYDITDMFRLRATRSLDIRSPAFSELFLLPNNSFQNIRDVNGVTAAIPTIVRPNPGLQAEKAKTWTVGAVVQPRWASSALRLSVDYYDIRMEGRIVTLTGQQIVDACASTGDSAYCQYVVRDSAGSLTQVITPNLNAGASLTDGFDLEVSYALRGDAIASRLNGNFLLRALATRALHNYTVVDGVKTEYVGAASTLGSFAEGVPHWRADFSGTYSADRYSLRLGARYVGGVIYSNGTSPFYLNAGQFPSRTYVDVGVSYTAVKSESTALELFGTVNNVFNKAPPIIPQPTGIVSPSLSDYSLYDGIGRTFMLGVRIKL